MALSRLPSDLYGVLEQYRIDARRRTRSNVTGEHLTRRKGQSLEFEDYKPYTAGDDTRHLDLRAATRVHGYSAMRDPAKWLIREFVAEEQLRLFISIDTHPTMFYPRVQSRRRRRSATFDVSKMQFALWLAEALTIVATESADTVIWHPLFNDGQIDKHFRVDRRDAVAIPIDALSKRLNADTLALNIEPLERELKPAFVWVIMSDFYFTDSQHIAQFREWVLRAQRGNRWVILLDLDSWAFERAMLATGHRRIQGYNVGPADKRQVYTDEEQMQKVLSRIIANKNRIYDFTIQPHHVQWEAAFDTQQAFQNFFIDFLQTNSELKTVFMRNA